MDEKGAENILSLADYRLRKQGGAREGGETVGSALDGFECGECGIQFPRIFRASYPTLMQGGDGELLATGSRFVHYQLTAEVKYLNGALPGLAPATFEPMEVLRSSDRCWLELYHFLEPEEAIGFAYAATRLQKREDRSALLAGKDGMYVLLVREDEPLLYGLITYHAQQKVHLHGREEVHCHTSTIGMDGSISLGDPLDLLAEGYVPASNDELDDESGDER